jgi:uncharacterized membrane protein
VSEQEADADDDLDELLEELEDIEETADSHRERDVLQRTIGVLDRVTHGRIFGLDDLAQQVTGGFILSAPFVVTEEVWALADGMNRGQWAVVVVLVFGIGYAALYGANSDRSPERERQVLGVPFRYVSLILTSYLAVSILALVLGAPSTFEASGLTTAKAVSVGAVFSVVGAATADSVF